MFKLGKADLPAKHPGLAWMVEHAGTLQTLFGRGEDGLTPWHRLKGKPWRIPLPCFGEVVEFKLRTRHKLEGRWLPGIFIGVKRLTTDKIVGDETGVYVVQSIRRVEEGSRWGAGKSYPSPERHGPQVRAPKASADTKSYRDLSRWSQSCPPWRPPAQALV